MDGESRRSEHHQQPMTPRQFQDWRNSLGKSSAPDQDRLNLQGLDQGPAQDKETLPGLDQGPAQNEETLPGPDQGLAQDKERPQGLEQGLVQDEETLHVFNHGPAQDQASRKFFHQVQDQDRSLGSNKCTTEEQDPSIKVSVQDEDPPGNQDYQCNLDLEQCTAHSADQGENRLSGVNQDPVYLGPAQDPSSPHDIPILVSAGNQNQTQDSNHDLAGGMDLPHCTDPTPKQDQEKLLGSDQEQALVDPDRRLNPNQDHTTDEACGEDAGGEQGGCIPAVVITQTEGSRGPVVNQGGETAPEVTESRVEAGPLWPQTPAERPEIPTGPERPQELAIAAMIPVTTLDLSPSPLSADLSPSLIEGGDLLACCDLLSLKSDTVSLARSEGYVQEEDTRSVAASSVMSVFPRIQLDPLEKDWLRSCALGNTAALRQLLTQDSSLASKKDFITGTALHWAAKQGSVEGVDMMARTGVDVNIKSHGGYTALHLASIHGHHHIIQLLINIYNARTNIRDYHGKLAAHYWSGNADVFNKPGSQSCGKWSSKGGRKAQRYTNLPSLLLSRSRSQGNLNNLEFGTAPQTPRPPRSPSSIDFHSFQSPQLYGDHF